MSFEEFWHGPLWLAESYRRARELEPGIDFQPWLTGQYAYRALLAASPVLNPFMKADSRLEYPSAPLSRGAGEASERDAMEDIRSKVEMFAIKWNARMGADAPGPDEGE